MMCPGLWTLDLGCDSPLDSRAFTLRFLCSSLTRFILSYHRFVFGLHLLPLHHAPYAPPYTRAYDPSLRTTITYITSMISIHRERHPSNFIRAHLYSDLSFHSISCLFLFTFLLFTTFYAQVLSISFHAHSCFMSITVLICHSSRLSVSILSCLSLCHAHHSSTATHKPSHTAAQYNFS